MNARGQRVLERRNTACKGDPAGPREENQVESDTEDEDILEERDQVPLRIPGARGRGGPTAAEVPAAIDLGDVIKYGLCQTPSFI